MKKLLITFCAVFAMSACTSTEQQVVETETNKKEGVYAGVDVANKRTFTEEEVRKVMAEIKKTGFECKIERTTGSKLGRKKCSTKRQREQLRKMAEQRIRESKNRMSGPAG